MKGIGTDIVQVNRVQDSLDKLGDRFVQRILTEAEQAIFIERAHSISFLANRFAAKEAISKALGTGIAKGVTFKNIEVLPDELGAPAVFLSGQAHSRLEAIGASEMKVSISDERDYSVAFAVAV